MYMKPIIGLTPIDDTERDSLWMLPGYMQGLENVGGVGVMLPQTDDPAILKELVTRMDGILLTGGKDVDPGLYGERRESDCGVSSAMRDRMETRLIELALQADKPVFGICRGLQILNAVLGGTLYQDLKKQTETTLTHNMPKPYDRTIHEVTILPDTPLAALYGPGPLAVISADTAISIMAVNAKQELVGGVILPGPQLSLAALVQNTAQLPQIDLSAPAASSILGKNTSACLQNGFVLGTAGLLDGLAAHFQSELGPDIRFYATGNLPRTIREACRTPIQYREYLITDGLYRIWQKNRKW